MNIPTVNFNGFKAESLEYDTEDEQSKRTKDAYIICETAGGPRIFIG